MCRASLCRSIVLVLSIPDANTEHRFFGCVLSVKRLGCVCRYAYVITCTNVVKEGDNILEVHAEGRKVKDDEKPPKVSPAVLHIYTACRPFLLSKGAMCNCHMCYRPQNIS